MISFIFSACEIRILLPVSYNVKPFSLMLKKLSVIKIKVYFYAFSLPLFLKYLRNKCHEHYVKENI